MSALLACAAGYDDSAFARARAELDAQGLGAPRIFQCGDAQALWYPGYGNISAEQSCLEIGDGFVACVGTLFHEGRTGAAALRSLWESFDDGNWSRDEPWGNWVVAIARNGRLWLAQDQLGMVKVYEHPRARLFSTSWLACVAAGSSSHLDWLGTIDYVLAGASHGPRTPVVEVQVLDPATEVELTASVRRPRSKPSDWFTHEPPASVDAAVHEAAELLIDRAATIRAGFGERIHCALSGGFDSRLIFAALRAAGAQPSIHVYGADGDADVRVAQRITRSLGVPLTHVDKDAAESQLAPLTAQSLVERMRFFDGIPSDHIFDRGTDRDTRLRQSALGSIALNGGGGEILRNFFYLSDRPFDVMQVVQTFYGNHDPKVARRPDDLHEYFAYLAESIGAQIGHVGTLSRREVEAVYPLFRARFWTSRNNVLAARCGHFLTPLLDPALVRLALSLPLRWKDYGRFEARLITALDPALGVLPLSYGFKPIAGPSMTYMAKMWLQHHRPPSFRANTVRIRRLTGGLPAPRPPPGAPELVAPPYRLDDLLDLRRLADDGQLARALTLECVLRHFSIG